MSEDDAAMLATLNAIAAAAAPTVEETPAEGTEVTFDTPQPPVRGLEYGWCGGGG